LPKAPIINGKSLSPCHYSEQNGWHADHGQGADKVHIPYRGQTNLNMMGNASYENDTKLKDLGGSLDLTGF
jgi:hypothetical protein